MKKIFVLFATVYCFGAFAVNPDSEIGRNFMESAMPECVDSVLNEGIGLGIASEYCKCVSNKIFEKLTIEQITEYYNNGREIEDVAKECMQLLAK